MILNRNFYTNYDCLTLGRLLLGKFLCTKIDGKYTSGMIVETESYLGITDKASHAYNNTRTKRTETMYMQGGTAYIYLCYGIHHLFNVVSEKEDTPNAVLIRAIEPVDGVDIMLKRRKRDKVDIKLTSGPGTLTQALGIKTLHDKEDLTKKLIWIEDRGVVINDSDIISSARIGIDYAGEDAKLPYRFRIKDNKWTSRAVSKFDK